MKLSDLMLTDEQRQEAKLCDPEDNCDTLGDYCVACKAHERAAIANAVVVLESKYGIKHLIEYARGVCDPEEYQQDHPAYVALLAECRKVVGK